jgi:hypothetical protein
MTRIAKPIPWASVDQKVLRRKVLTTSVRLI